MIYNGRMDEAMSYWRACGHAVPHYANPTDFYLDLVTPGSPTDHTDEFVEHFKKEQKPQIDKIVNVKIIVRGRSARELLEETRDTMTHAQMYMSALRFQKHA